MYSHHLEGHCSRGIPSPIVISFPLVHLVEGKETSPLMVPRANAITQKNQLVLRRSPTLAEDIYPWRHVWLEVDTRHLPQPCISGTLELDVSAKPATQ